MNIERREIIDGLVKSPYFLEQLGREVSGYSCVGCAFNRNSINTYFELKETESKKVCVSCFYSEHLLGHREPPEELQYLPEIPIPKPQKIEEPR